MSDKLIIRSATIADAQSIAGIYNWYIKNSHSTFEEASLTAHDMAQRIEKIGNMTPWIVLLQEGLVVGYAYAAPWNIRVAYKYTRETSIYLDHQGFGQGWGRKLYQHLIDELRKTPIHILIAGIALPNEASIALHESLGFKKVGQFFEVGSKFGKYIDVAYWQLML